MPAPPRLVHLDQLDAVPGPGTLTWRPVRRALGIRAFGCGAYTAGEAGQDVVEAHNESGSDHEELYFVAAGRASFTIDGESYDAPSGTYVFVPDPTSERQATAVEPGTTVLSFGGPPTFEPSAWEWAFLSNPLLRSDPDRARDVLEEGLQVHPDAGALHYQLACLESLRGNREAALAALRLAVEYQPGSVMWAREDQDLAALRGDPAFESLIAG